MLTAQIRSKREERMRTRHHWQLHLDEIVVEIDGEKNYPWRAVDHENEVL